MRLFRKPFFMTLTLTVEVAMSAESLEYPNKG
jgi:hypothetical protein